MDYTKKRKIVERAKKLKDYEYVHLFRIIKQNLNAKYSSNKNGVFINLQHLDEETLMKIDQYLNFVEGKGDLNTDELGIKEKKETAGLKKLEYENIYHQCYQDLSNYQKTLLKQNGQMPKK